MPSLKFPDTGTRMALMRSGRPAVGAGGTNAVGYLYADEACTMPAEAYADSGGVKGALLPLDEAEGGRRVVLNGFGEQPDYWGPSDGSSVLWLMVNGVVSRVNADYNARLTAASTSQPGLVQFGGTAGRAVPGDYLPYDVRWSGVVGDGTTDDTASLLDAVAVCSGASKRVLHIPSDLNVRITGQVDAQLVRHIDCPGTITVAYTGGPGLIVGDTSTQRNGCTYRFSRVVYAGGGQTNVALRIVGLKSGRVTVGYCDYLQLYANEAVASQSSIAYNSFFLGRVKKLEMWGEAGSSWINENQFFGGSFETLLIDAVDYAHNNNAFHGCSVETSASSIQILRGACNRIYARGEGGPSVTFGATTWANQVVGTYVSAPGSHGTLFTVSDQGTDNIVTSALDEQSTYYELLRVDKNSVMFNATSEWTCPTASVPVPGLDKLRTRVGNAVVLDTGLMPVRLTYPSDGGVNYYRNWSMRRLNIDSDAALWRPLVQAYDASGALIDPTVTPWMLTTGGWVANSTGYTFGINVSFAQVTVTGAAVEYLRITVSSSGAAGAAFGYLRLLAYVNRPQADSGIGLARKVAGRPLYQATAPTQGAAKVGRVVNGPTSSWVCTSRVDTTLSAAAASGDTVLTVNSIAGMFAGDVIGVLLDDRTTHWATVSSAPSGSSVTLSSGLPSGAAIGRAVVTNTWTAVAGGGSGGSSALGCPTGYWLVPGASYTTSAGATDGALIAVPVQIPRSGTASAVGFEFTAASADATTPVVRLGLYADDGNGRPGNLLADAGTVSVASGTTPGQVSLPVSASVTAGWYWLVAVVQGTTTSVPTLRTINTGQAVALPAMNQSTSVVRLGYSMSGVTGSLPASWSSWSTTAFTPKMMLQLN